MGVEGEKGDKTARIKRVNKSDRYDCQNSDKSRRTGLGQEGLVGVCREGKNSVLNLKEMGERRGARQKKRFPKVTEVTVKKKTRGKDYREGGNDVWKEKGEGAKKEYDKESD